MQQPAVPELAHTHARPIHWLATATAVAGVVALSSLVQSHEATAAQTPGTGTKAAPAAPAAPPTTAGVDFPLECGPVQAAVKRTATGDVDGDGRPETLAVVHCDAPMGTPPDALYVLTQGPHDTEPRVVATLIDPKSRNTVTQVAVHDGTVRATLLGYSNDSVPACCPDTKQTVKWQWKDGVFVRYAPVNAHAV